MQVTLQKRVGPKVGENSISPFTFNPNNFSFSQAAKLVGMGASVDDLTQSCGLSQSEAELMRKLHQARRESD